VPIAIAVFEDYHFMGKRIIKSYLNSYGFKIIDYGRVETQELIQNVLRDNVKILLISTLMLNSALHIKELASELNRIKPETKIIVGGAPFIFDKNLYKEIGADDAGYDANDAFNLVKKYLEIKTNT
jgi:methanogenic corrinoid protein MtbC1